MFIRKAVEKLREENPDMPKTEAIKQVMQQVQCKRAMGDGDLEEWMYYVTEVVHNHFIDTDVCC